MCFQNIKSIKNIIIMKERALCINSRSTNALLVYSRDVDTGSDFF